MDGAGRFGGAGLLKARDVSISGLGARVSTKDTECLGSLRSYDAHERLTRVGDDGRVPEKKKQNGLASDCDCVAHPSLQMESIKRESNPHYLTSTRLFA